MTGSPIKLAWQQAAAQARYAYDPGQRSYWAEREFIEHQSRFTLGTPEWARFLLSLIGNGFPTPLLTEAYFSTLDHLLADKPVQPEPGQLVLGFGAGRTGSTSLVAMIATIDGAIATHENPPCVFWTPLEAQLDFHRRRFHRLLQHFPLVVDVAHWSLPAFEAMRAAFPQIRCIGLERDVEACTESFMVVKSAGGFNHWAPPRNGLWAPGLWDPTYPTYPLPDDAALAPDRVKREMIRRYVGEYNVHMRLLAAAEPERWLIVQTDTLAKSAMQQRIFDFVGHVGSYVDRHYNAGSTLDSEQMLFTY